MVIIPDRGWKFTAYFFYFLMFFFLFRSCEKSSLPVLSGQVRLTAAEVGVTEAWLRVQTEQVSGEFSLNLWRDDTCIFQGAFRRADTTVYDSTLLPAHRYRYRARLQRSGHPLLESPPLEITTLDTTSHEFQWEVIEFPSPYGSGALYDVAIIDENNIWAVGEIYADSAQPWLPYNAVHWDGQDWELMRIKTNACGGVVYPPIESIFAFSANDVLLAHIDGSISHYNGNTFTNDCSLITQLNGSVKKMWGRSRNDLYVVSVNGFIAHYNGTSWQKLESGTTLPIMGIYGARKNGSGQYEILCVAEHISPGGSKVLSIDNTNVRELQTTGLLSWGLWGIWFIPEREYIVVGSGVWRSHLHFGNWMLDNRLPNLFSTSIDGTDLNDIVVAGAFWLLAHYNGMNWETYFPTTSGSFTSVAMRNDMVIVVGGTGSQPVVAVGRR